MAGIVAPHACAQTAPHATPPTASVPARPAGAASTATSVVRQEPTATNAPSNASVKMAGFVTT